MTMSAAPLRRPLPILSLLFLLLCSGCASVNNPRDPLEPFNRAMYQVNDGLDKVIMKPVATAYRSVLPELVRTGVTNFFNNLYDIITALNNLLQGKVADAVSDIGRMAVNSTVGVLGLIDVGTEIGLEKHREDFGQTLGRWGLGSGAYLQLPFLGPSSIRDGVGLFADSKIDPVKLIWRHHIPTRNSLWGLYYINLRANLLDSTKILDEAALDPYEFQRDAYLQRRRNLVYDGNPPPEQEKEEDIPELKTKPRTESDEPAGQPRAERAEPQAEAPAGVPQPSTETAITESRSPATGAAAQAPAI